MVSRDWKGRGEKRERGGIADAQVQPQEEQGWSKHSGAITVHRHLHCVSK